MSRVLLYVLLSAGLLMPPGFCPCHVGDSDGVCAEIDDHDAPADDHSDQDPNCPCHNVDAGIRAFRSHDSAEVVGPAVTSAILIAPQFVRSDADLRSRCENVVPFSMPPRNLVYLTLRI